MTITTGGTTTPLILEKTAGAGQDAILRIKTSDDANSMIQIENATGTDGTFIPVINCKQGGTSNTVFLMGSANTDTGSNAVIVLDARTISGSAITTRPLVRVQTLGTTKATFNVNDFALAEAYNVVVGTTTGTKIGTSTSQKIGFLNATPASQQTGGAATAGGTYGATEQGMLQKAYDCLRTFGFLS
jgi:hypothetical protein